MLHGVSAAPVCVCLSRDLADLVKSFLISGPQTPGYSQLRFAISSNLPQELRKLIEYEAAVGLVYFICFISCFGIKSGRERHGG